MEEVTLTVKMASSTTLFGIVLAVSIFGAGVVADRLTNVYLTNLPLDEQGNLKVKSAEKPLETYRDALKIKALDESSHQYGGNDWGVHVYTFNQTLPFVFTPKEEFLQVTDVWVTVTTIDFDYTDHKLDVSINDEPPITSPIHWCYLTSLNMFTIHVQDESAYNSIVKGINILTVSSPMRRVDGGWDLGWTTLYQVTILIEYEYQA